MSLNVYRQQSGRIYKGEKRKNDGDSQMCSPSIALLCVLAEDTTLNDEEVRIAIERLRVESGVPASSVVKVKS